MNEIVNKLSLAGDKFIPKMHLRQPGLKETGDLWYNYHKELDKACFQHHRAYGDFKDLPRRTASDKLLHDKVFDIVKKSKI